MFLGAETIRPLLKRLVPHASVETRPRLSQLSYAGPAKLVRLPPRSAVVAFSAQEVYAIAELIRRRRGGCAVVMGRLSPRTRNAQVALYQEKEVDFLVATDAIGMGLNMNVDHVAFAGLGKFDGHRPRRLTAAEMGQIAGRAGRGMRDGTFGTTTECKPIPEEAVRAIEAHSFDALEQICWRNNDLDFSHIDTLLASLQEPVPRSGLVRGNDASDLETLIALAREPEIRDKARGRARLRLLWDACQIPDFRKLTDETHNRLCARIFGHIVNEGSLPTDWLAGQIAALDRTEGDIDTLMSRLSGVRIWSYIAARSDWVKDAEHWQGKAREVEDKLSDVLHERLTTRFVDRRSTHLMRRLDATDGQELLSAVTRRGEVVVEGHPVGMLEGFTFAPDPSAAGDEKKLVLRAARRALREEVPRRVTLVEGEPDTALSLTPTHRIVWGGAPVARIVGGATALSPRVQILDSEFLDGAQRERLRLRLQRFLDDRIRTDLAALFVAADAAERVQGARGPLHRLRETLGLVPGVDEETLAPELRTKLKAIGVRSGRFALFLPAVMKPRAAAMRARLWSVRHGFAMPSLPGPGVVSLPAATDWPPGFSAMMGWVEAGPVLLRVDIAERVAGELGYATRKGFAPLPPGLASRFAVKADMLPAVLRVLGFRVVPGGGLAPEEFGPPAPPMLAPLRRRRVVAAAEQQVVAPLPHGPFAALAALKR